MILYGKGCVFQPTITFRASQVGPAFEQCSRLLNGENVFTPRFLWSSLKESTLSRYFSLVS